MHIQMVGKEKEEETLSRAHLAVEFPLIWSIDFPSLVFVVLLSDLFFIRTLFFLQNLVVDLECRLASSSYSWVRG